MEIFKTIIITFITGAIGGQILNHFIIGRREKIKKNSETKKKFYIPLYSAIISYFEQSTAFRPGDITTNLSPFEKRKEIVNYIEKNFDFANDKIAEAFYRIKQDKLYDDNKGTRDLENEHQLFYLTLKSYYSLHQSEDLKRQILLFQIWHLSIIMNIPSPDHALAYKFYFDLKKLASNYTFDDFEQIISAGYERQKLFMEKLLEAIVKKEDLENILQQFFEPENLYENHGALFYMYLVDEIINGTGQGTLRISDRQVLRKALLNNLYMSYFYEDGYIFTQEKYEESPLEKKLALDYLEDKGLIKKIEDGNGIIKFTPTAKGIDEYEKEFFEK